MRVLQVVPGLAARTGGPAVAVVEAARALSRLGVECTIVSTDLAGTATAAGRRPVRPDELPAGLESLDARLFPARPPRRLAFAPALGRALARETSGYDVVHIHSLFLYPQWAAYRSARKAGVPYVVSPHGQLDPYLRRRGRARKGLTSALWQNRLLERAAALHFVAADEAGLATDVAPAVPRAVIPNALDLAAFANLPPGDDFRERYLDGHAGPLVLYLGRIAQKKGIDLLIRSFARVARELPDTLLAVAGPDDEGLAEGLAALAEAEGVGGRTCFTGMLHGEDKRAALAAADVWVLSSYSDAHAIAVSEALAAGLPVVLTPAVNVAREIAADGAAVVAAAEPAALGEAVLALLRDPERRRELGERGRAFARRYGHDAVGRELASLYERVASEAPA